MNQEVFSILILLFEIIILLFSGLLVLIFYNEDEIQAIKKTILPSLFLMSIFLLIYTFHLVVLFYIILSSLIIFLIALLYPGRNNKNYTDDIPHSRFDERDIMFSRNELKSGTQKYIAYYKDKPELEEKDLFFRKEAGLLSPKSKYYHKEAFKIANANFAEVDKLHPRVSGNKADEAQSYEVIEISRKLKKEAIRLGALNAGICQCKAYHFYSIKGRGSEYGQPIELKHDFAIAFTVEMDQTMVSAAPKAGMVVESSRQYLTVGKIAIKLAEIIREMGYDARAHIDGNYQVICPLVARDAGIGEIGRMGLLMTPSQGPRVRLGVVTTNLQLIEDKYKRNHALIDFCRICKKCAVSCPSSSIPEGEPIKIDSVKRWKINSESCFTYWCKTGTDCGKCMAVCPYSHPDHSLHKLVRFGISRSVIMRHLSYKLDNYFYGKKPNKKSSDKKWEKRMRTLN
jgi:ferredoxin